MDFISENRKATDIFNESQRQRASLLSFMRAIFAERFTTVA